MGATLVTATGTASTSRRSTDLPLCVSAAVAAKAPQPEEAKACSESGDQTLEGALIDSATEPHGKDEQARTE